MRRLKRAAVVCAAVASVTAGAGAPAHAQEGGIQEGVEPIAIQLDTSNPCLTNPSVPACVNAAFDLADYAIVTAEAVYNQHARKFVCDAHYILSGDQCVAPAL